MRIIFLDVDGVLNNDFTKERCGVYTGIDNCHLEILKQIYTESNKVDTTEIVLSSSWRAGVNNNNKFLDEGYEYLTSRLKEFDLTIYDETPLIKKHIKNDMVMSRGYEILTWLESHKYLKIKGVVVLDDVRFEDYEIFGINKHLVKTSWYDEDGGLQDFHVKVALRLLNEPVHIKRPEDKEWQRK